MRGKLEVCVDSVESAVIAKEAGADCLEVCANLIIGGTTPGVSQFRQIRKACDIELNVLVRPRFGDFLYTDAEFQMIEEDIQMFGELGADGVVIGCLKADGSLDLDRMEKLKTRAGQMHVTLHRHLTYAGIRIRHWKKRLRWGLIRFLPQARHLSVQKEKQFWKS